MFVGIENEYTCFTVTKKGNKNVFVTVAESLDDLMAKNEELFLFYGGGRRGLDVPRGPDSAWLINGGRIYADLEAVEYASPECVSIEEVMLAEKAGDWIVKKICEHCEGEVFLLKRSATEDLRSMTTARFTWGAHESYSVTKRLFSDIRTVNAIKRKVLVSFLASREVVTGAGHLAYIYRGRPPSFLLSPRIHFLEKEYSETTRGADRGIINSRDESFMAGNLSYLHRLHLILGDTNRSDWSVYLKLGITALILSYLEDASKGDLGGLYNRFLIKDPVESAQLASLVFNGEEASQKTFAILVDFQLRLRDEVAKREELKERFPEFDQVIELWSGALEAARQAVFGPEGKEYELFSRRLDWLIKKKVFEMKMGEKIQNLSRLGTNEILETQLLSLGFSYDRLNKNDFYRHLIKTGVAEEKASLKETERLIHGPPRDRASLRVAVAKYLESNDLLQYVKIFDMSGVSLGKTGPAGLGNSTYVPFDHTAFSEVTSKIETIINSLRR